MASDHDSDAQSGAVEALAATIAQGGSTVAIRTPRVGGVVDGVAWVGGSNLPGEENEEPDDILCFRPHTFREMQRQHDELKKGLENERRLEIGNKDKVSVGLTMWITWLKMILVTRGMDTVFLVCDVDEDEETCSNQVSLLDNWGKLTKNKLKLWIDALQGDFGKNMTS